MRIHRSIGVAILLLCLAACQSRLSQDNFDKVHEGMTQKEVRDILGDPVSVEGGSFLGIISGGEAVWKDDKTVITVHFLNEKVVSKRMSRADAKGAVAKAEDEKAPPPPPPPKSQ